MSCSTNLASLSHTSACDHRELLKVKITPPVDFTKTNPKESQKDADTGIAKKDNRDEGVRPRS